jgi:PadR family transcriptional regulator
VFRLRGDAYGRAILQEVQMRLDRDVAAGAVHATLVRLERRGLLRSSLGPGTEVRAGRPRRYYQLEPSGRRALNETRDALAALWRGLKRPLGGHA